MDYSDKVLNPLQYITEYTQTIYSLHTTRPKGMDVQLGLQLKQRTHTPLNEETTSQSPADIQHCTHGFTAGFLLKHIYKLSLCLFTVFPQHVHSVSNQMGVWSENTGDLGSVVV